MDQTTARLLLKSGWCPAVLPGCWHLSWDCQRVVPLPTPLVLMDQSMHQHLGDAQGCWRARARAEP